MVVLLEGQLLAAGRAAMQSADGISNAYIAEYVTTLRGDQFSTCSFKLRGGKEKIEETGNEHNIAETTFPT